MRFITTVLFSLLATSAISTAQANDETLFASGKGYTCQASGAVSVGGPVGDIWNSVRADGRDEYEAMQNALSRCHGAGYRQCRIDYCQKK